MNVGEVLTANKKREERGNAFKVTIVDSSVTYSPLSATQGRSVAWRPSKRLCSKLLQSKLVVPFWPLNDMQLFLFKWNLYLNCSKQSGQANKMKCGYMCNYCVQRCDIYLTICNQSITSVINLSIDCYWNSITTQVFAIDWSSIINISRLIDIDWYWLRSIVIDWKRRKMEYKRVRDWSSGRGLPV